MILELKESACTSCGKCAADCPAMIISMDGGKPCISPDNEANCFDCHHCMAVCPEGAITINGAKPENSITLDGYNPETADLGLLVQARRSCRNFKQENVDSALIDKLIDLSAYAPTGRNAVSVSFTVIDRLEDMAKFTDAAKSVLKMIQNNRSLPEQASFFYDYIAAWTDMGVNTFFRNAPHILVLSAPKSIVTPETDCVIAGGYFELLAHANGLGAYWNGLATYTISALAPELKKWLGIPEDHVIGYVLSFGYPAVEYARTAQRKPKSVNRVRFNP